MTESGYERTSGTLMDFALALPPSIISRPGCGASILQANTTGLAPAGWADVVGTPTVDGSEQFLQFAAGSGNVFFRLRKL